MGKYKRPYLVLRSQQLIPLDCDYRIEEFEGEWYVLGQHQAILCESETLALARLRELLHEHDAHALAAEALASLPLDYEVRSQRS